MAEPPAWRSIRVRLLIIALLPLLFLTPVLLGITMQRWLWRTDQILSARVVSDLTVAQQYLAHLQEAVQGRLDALGRSAAFRDDPSAALAAALRDEGLDFLRLVPVDRFREAPASPLAALARAVSAARGLRGLAVLDPHDLAALAPGLADRARIPLVETEASAPSDRQAEDRGLVVLAVAPAPLPGGGRGALLGGVLLNRNEGFIDRISDLVYPATDPAQPARIRDRLDRGVITLFLGDARISTTLRPSGAERALGTRASAAVADQVLGRGEPWRGTAFVVNGWYVSAYEPVRDIAGARAGMLYAGVPMAPYAQARLVTLGLVLASFLASVALFAPLFLSWARGIFGPVEAMGQTIDRVEAGDLDARTGPGTGADEIRRLAAHLDRLLDRLRQRDGALRELNASLNARVEARTADLLAANRALEAATRQLVLSEKLATIGEVTAGVAHEINNPLAVISGNIEVLRMALADGAQDVETELDLIEDQTLRIGRLVGQLLQFARPEEFNEGAEATDPAEVIAGLRPLVDHLLAAAGVRLEERATSSGRISMNRHELQQVLVNLVSNAVQAMPGGGLITLDCADAPDGSGIRITVRDTGTGMDEATLARIFDPFFTSRGQGGTGLGLSICQALVNRQGGEIAARSRPGAGATFTIRLPSAGRAAGLS